MDFDDEALKLLVESNLWQSTRELSKMLSTTQFTIYQQLEKIWKVSKLGVWVSHALREKNKADH